MNAPATIDRSYSFVRYVESAVSQNSKLTSFTTSEAKVTPTLPSSYTAFDSWGGVWYRKTGRFVEVSINAIAQTTNLTELFVLPSGYIPDSEIYSIGMGNEDSGTAFCHIRTNGKVYVKTSNNFVSTYCCYIV